MPLEDLDHMLRRFLYLQIEALEQAAKEADEAAKKKARNEAFASATGPAIAIVGASLTTALVFAGLVHLELVGLFVPGHTSKEAMGLFSQMTSILPADITSLVSADDLKGATVAFLALVAAHAAINRTVGAAVAITLINVLLAAEFIVIGGSRALGYPPAAVYLLVGLAVVVTTVTIDRLLPIGVQGELSEAPLPAWRWIKEQLAPIESKLRRVTRRTLRPDPAGRRRLAWPTWVVIAITLLAVLMLPSGLAVITLWDALRVSWLLPLGLAVAAIPLLVLLLAIIGWARRGILTKPSLHPRAMTVMQILPWVTIIAVVLLELYFGPKPSITVVNTALAFVELGFIVGFALWFLWPEVAANFAAKALFLTVFSWLIAAAFYYGSNSFSLLLAAVLAISLPRAMPVRTR